MEPGGDTATAGRSVVVVATLRPAVILSSDDPRHGLLRGYSAGCKCPRCLAAHREYHWRRRLVAGQPYESSRVPSFGAVRRLWALQAVGHSFAVVSTDSGIPAYYLQRLANWQWNRIALWRWEAIDDSYLWMASATPKNSNAARLRREAAEKGWSPPTAWPGDSIDDPSAEPELDSEAGTIAS